MYDDTKGIDTEEIRSVVLLLNSYKKGIERIFEDYNTLINGTSKYFEGNVGYEFRKKFNAFNTQLSLITDSINDYSNALYDMIRAYGGDKAAKVFEEALNKDKDKFTDIDSL